MLQLWDCPIDLGFLFAWAGLKLLVCTGTCLRCEQAHSSGSTSCYNRVLAPFIPTNRTIPDPHSEMFFFGNASQEVIMSQLMRCYRCMQRGFLYFFILMCRKEKKKITFLTIHLRENMRGIRNIQDPLALPFCTADGWLCLHLLPSTMDIICVPCLLVWSDKTGEDTEEYTPIR